MDRLSHGDRSRPSPELAELDRRRTDAPVHAWHEVGTPFAGYHDLIGGGAVTGWISQSGRCAPLIVGTVVLTMFLPVHIAIWSKFPAWYHLVFLLTIIPAVLAGALLQRSGTRAATKDKLSSW